MILRNPETIYVSGWSPTPCGQPGAAINSRIRRRHLHRVELDFDLHADGYGLAVFAGGREEPLFDRRHHGVVDIPIQHAALRCLGNGISIEKRPSRCTGGNRLSNAGQCRLQWKARTDPVPRQFDVVIERDSEGYYVASVPQIPGCHTQARSLDEVTERIREAIALCLEVQGMPAQQLEFIGIQRVTISA